MDQNYRGITRVVTVLIIAAALFCGSILIFSIVKHKYALNALYSVLPAAFTVLFVSLLWCKEPYRTNFTVMLLMTGLVVYAGEIVVGYAELYRHYHAFIERKYDKLELIERLRERGTLAYPIFSSNEILMRKLTLDGCVPLGGISRATTILGNEGGTWVLYERDEHGFNNPRGIWNADSVDVVTVGDSFVHGLAVEPGQDISSHIRKRYPLTLNIGYAGNGPLRDLASIAEYGEQMRPRFVLWFYYENDLSDLRVSEKGSLFHKYLRSDFSQRLIERQAFIDSALSHIVEESLEREIDRKGHGENVRGRAVRTVMKQRPLLSIVMLKSLRKRIRFLFPESTDISEELALFAEILADANGRVEAWGGRLLFVYLPGKSRYTNPRRRDSIREDVLSLVGRLGIPVIDMHTVFSSYPRPLALFPEREVVHYNARGYELVAETVLGIIRAERGADPLHGME